MANWLTISRFPLLALVVALFQRASPAMRLAAVGVMFIGLMMDTVDGLVARKRGETSLLGSVLDIAADRTYELVLWIFFAAAGIVPVIMPIVVAGRTALTDALRSVGVAQGAAPLTQHRTALGKFLVGSAWMRIGYQASKVLAFCGMGMLFAGAGGGIAGAVRVVAWIAVGFCVLRGVPVLAHAAREHQGRTAAA